MNKRIFVGPVIIVLIWYLLFLIHFINPLFLPAPHTVVVSFVKLILDYSIFADIALSVGRIILSFFIAAFLGIPIGLLLGYYDKLYEVWEIVIDFFRSLPALAVFPLLMFFFGIGETAKVATAVFSCIFIIIINTIYGVSHSNKTLRTVAILMEARTDEIFKKVIFMDSLPQIMIGLRTSLSLAIIVIIVTEMFIGTRVGIGYKINNFQLTYRVPEMYSAIIIAGMIGYFMNKIFRLIEKRIIHWKE